MVVCLDNPVLNNSSPALVEVGVVVDVHQCRAQSEIVICKMKEQSVAGVETQNFMSKV